LKALARLQQVAVPEFQPQAVLSAVQGLGLQAEPGWDLQEQVVRQAQ
jgi:hypothetical protein